jgi:hypothetical protein
MLKSTRELIAAVDGHDNIIYVRTVVIGDT